jgi:hypothetical protein
MFAKSCALALVLLASGAVASPALVRGADEDEAVPDLDKATHPSSRFIKVAGSKGTGLQTLTILPDGHIVGLVALGRYEAVGGGKNAKKKPQPELRLYDAEGTEVRKWTLPFNGHSVAAAPDGSILVAGEAKIARYSAEGNLLREAELSYVADVLKNKEKLTELAEGRRESMVEMYERYATEEFKEQIDEFKKKAADLDKQIEELKAKEPAKKVDGEKAKDKDAKPEPAKDADSKPKTAAAANPLLQVVQALFGGGEEEQELMLEEDFALDVEEVDPNATPLQKLERQRKIVGNNLKFLEQQSQVYAKEAESAKNRPVQEYIDEIVEGASRVYSIACNDKEVFVASGELTGYGYSLWRMGTEFDEPTRVIKKLSGCCGQIDVQAKGDVLFVADNTQHAVTKYDREGKKLASFGETGRVSEGLKFGGCCNPMNCRVDKQGFVYTAESEGVVKKFSEDGAFLALVGVAKLKGGCKNVAVAVSPDAKRVYFCDQPGSRIVILEPKDADERK